MYSRFEWADRTAVISGLHLSWCADQNPAGGTDLIRWPVPFALSSRIRHGSLHRMPSRLYPESQSSRFSADLPCPA
jgi:hypothetical protein